MFESILNDLNASSKGIVASGIVSIDGAPMAMLPHQGYSEDSLGGLSTALMHCGQKVAQDMLGGDLEWVCVKAEEDSLLVTRAGTEMLLVIWARPIVEAVLFQPEFERAVERIRVLGEIREGRAA